VIGDDLVGLFAPASGPGVGFRQGQIVAWNPQTGENVVNVGGTELSNLAILNTGEAIALKVGHVVGLLTMSGSWFIIGRITVPGDPDFASVSVDFGSAGAQVFGFSLASGTAVVKASSSELVVPAWADEAIVLVTGGMCAVNTSGATGWLSLQVGCAGGAGGGLPSDVGSNNMGQTSASSRNHFTGLNGGEILQITAEANANTNWPAHATNSVFIHAIAVYKSNV
jgi:hypothetical protein